MTVMKRVTEHYEKYKTDNFVVIGLQGSQNYDLAVAGSDVDTKMLVTPSLRQILKNHKPISTTRVLENDEHCDVKDVRLYWNCLRKQNINFVELLFTDWYIVNPKYKHVWDRLVNVKESIAFYDPHTAIKCMRGMAYEKRKALSHPYPSKTMELETYGYDPKQLHHILRLEEFMGNYIAGYPYEICLRESEQKEYLKEVKANGAGMNKIAAHIAADSAIQLMEEMAEYYDKTYEVSRDEYVEEFLDETLEEIVTIALREELSL